MHQALVKGPGEMRWWKINSQAAPVVHGLSSERNQAWRSRGSRKLKEGWSLGRASTVPL